MRIEDLLTYKELVTISHVLANKMNVSESFCIICHSVLLFLGKPLLKNIVKARMSFTCFLTP